MFNGHLTSEWEALQNEYYKEIKNSCKYRLGKTWTKTITQTIWSQWQVLWQLRNEVIHVLSRSRATCLHHAETKLHLIYSKQHSMLPSHRELLFPTMEDHLKLSATTILNWTTIHEPLFESGICQATKAATTGMQSMRSYLQTQTPRNPSSGWQVGHQV